MTGCVCAWRGVLDEQRAKRKEAALRQMVPAEREPATTQDAVRAALGAVRIG